MSSIYVPGHGTTTFEAYRVGKAVTEYDERLFFQRNYETGDWCVFIRMPGDEPAYPVIGFGAELPTVEEVTRRLHRADTMRHGWQIFDEIQKSQEDYKKQFRVAADEATDESTEVVEHFMRKHGKSPIIKVFMNDEKGVVNDDA